MLSVSIVLVVAVRLEQNKVKAATRIKSRPVFARRASGEGSVLQYRTTILMQANQWHKITHLFLFVVHGCDCMTILIDGNGSERIYWLCLGCGVGKDFYGQMLCVFDLV